MDDSTMTFDGELHQTVQIDDEVIREIAREEIDKSGGGSSSGGHRQGVYASDYEGSTLVQKISNALAELPNGRGRIRVTERDDGEPWEWGESLTVDLTEHRGFELDIDRSAGINYSGDGWALTLESNSGTKNQATITGGHWNGTGDPNGWLRLKDCFGTEVYPTRVEMRNSEKNATGVSLENHDGWTESSKIGGSYTADIGIDSKPAGVTGGEGTHSFHDTVLDNPKINAYNIGIRFRGWWQYCHIEKPVVWTKTNGVSCYLLASERMDGTTISSMKAEDPGANAESSAGIQTEDPFKGFWYGPTIVGGHIYVPNGEKVIDNASDSGPAIMLRTHEKEFQAVNLKTGDTDTLNP